MDCADHCICGDGHRDGLECDLLRGVLDEKSVLEFDSRTLCCWWIELLFCDKVAEKLLNRVAKEGRTMICPPLSNTNQNYMNLKNKGQNCRFSVSVALYCLPPLV